MFQQFLPTFSKTVSVIDHRDGSSGKVRVCLAPMGDSSSRRRTKGGEDRPADLPTRRRIISMRATAVLRRAGVLERRRCDHLRVNLVS